MNLSLYIAKGGYLESRPSAGITQGLYPNKLQCRSKHQSSSIEPQYSYHVTHWSVQ